MEKGAIFRFHDTFNPNCSIGGRIKAVLTPQLDRAQQAFEHVLANTTIACLLIRLIVRNSRNNGGFLETLRD